MGTLYTYNYTYSTNAIVLTKYTNRVSLKIYAEFKEALSQDEALNKVHELLRDIYKSEGFELDGGWAPNENFPTVIYRRENTEKRLIPQNDI